MASIRLKGREIPLIYTVWEMKQIQEEIAPMDEFVHLIFGRNRENEDDTSQYGGPKQLDAVAKLVRILGNAGLEEAGENPDLTEKKVLRAMKPTDIAGVINACMEAFNDGIRSEIPDRKPDGPVDVALEEMNKKKEKES